MILDSHIAFILLVNNLLCYIYFSFFWFINVQTLSLSFRIQENQFRKCKNGLEILNRRLLVRYHKLYVHHLCQFVNIDKNIVQRLYSFIIISTIGFHIVSLRILFKENVGIFTMYQCFVILSGTVILSVLSSKALVYLSKKLTTSSKHSTKFMSSKCARFRILGVENLFKFSYLMEIVHHKKKFYFNFGNVGKISHRSFTNYLIFYVSCYLYVSRKFKL